MIQEDKRMGGRKKKKEEIKPRICKPTPLVLPIDDAKKFLSLGSTSKVLIAVIRDEYVVLNADTADLVILFENVGVDVALVGGVFEEVALDVFAAEVTVVLVSVSSSGRKIERLGGFTFRARW